jgi:hypothetical protein
MPKGEEQNGTRNKQPLSKVMQHLEKMGFKI